MSCPDYYLLANGEEFVDYQERVLSMVAWNTCYDAMVTHCLLSMAEHRFREGFKQCSDPDHDRTAAKFWANKAIELGGENVPHLIGLINELVDIERGLKIGQEKVLPLYGAEVIGDDEYDEMDDIRREIDEDELNAIHGGEEE